MTDPSPDDSRRDRPLCVDLDGTLINSDATAESLLGCIYHKPAAALMLPLWFARGRAVAKHHIAQHVQLDPAALPYRQDVLSYIRGEKDAGRRIILATASDISVANAVAEHLGIFDDVIASNGEQNVKGKGKLKVLEEKLGADGFDYIGDSRADLPIWRAAGRAIMVNPSPGLRAKVKKELGEPTVFTDRDNFFATALEAMRPKQWTKNLLLAVPMFVGHQITPANGLHFLIAFICFSLTASAVYLLNDMFDLDADRKHPTKRYRPLASGRMSIWHALVLMMGCAVVSIVLALVLLRPMFTAMLLIYVVVTTAYTVYFKRVAVMDVILLAGLYTHRILAGGYAVSRGLDDGSATPITPSFWLLTFSAFLFLSLAFVKRFTELQNLQQSHGDEAAGRSYRVTDIEMMRSFGLVSGYLAVLVFCLYINSQAVLSLYHRPKVLWFVCPLLLYWISYLWLRAARGQVLEDPVTFTLRDPASYAIGAATAILILLAGG